MKLEKHEMKILDMAIAAMREENGCDESRNPADAPTLALAATLTHIRTVLVATFGDPDAA